MIPTGDMIPAHNIRYAADVGVGVRTRRLPHRCSDWAPPFAVIAVGRRPAAYAEAVVVADALCWHDAQASLAHDLGVPRSAVARALLFRLLTTNARVASGVDVEQIRDEARRYELAADVISV